MLIFVREPQCGLRLLVYRELRNKYSDVKDRSSFYVRNMYILVFLRPFFRNLCKYTEVFIL